MKICRFLLAAVLTVSLPGQFALAAPAVPSKVSEKPQSVQIPFDPPTDAPLKYKWEKSVQKDGKTDMNWSVAEYRFEKANDGYRLTVTLVDSGTNETDPAALAFLKRLEELTRRPFVLLLDENGSIKELENAELYWSTIFKVMREELGKKDGKPLDETGKRMVDDVVRTFESMPPENRLRLLTAAVQPVLEFGNVEISSAEPISSKLETASPFGGVLNRDVTINLKRVDGGIAYLSVRSSISRDELTKLMQAMLAKLESLPPEKRLEASEAFGAFKDFRHETAAEYDVSVTDGVLKSFRSVETIEVEDKKGASRKVSTETLELIE